MAENNYWTRDRVKLRMTRTKWYDLGGFSNPNLFRKMLSGTWNYWAYISLHESRIDR